MKTRFQKSGARSIFKKKKSPSCRLVGCVCVGLGVGARGASDRKI